MATPAPTGRFLVLFSVISCAGCGGSAPDVTLPRPHLISEENQRPGDKGWPLDLEGADPAFGAYARPLSLAAGERLDVQASVTSDTQVSWKIYRLGWYGGMGGRLLAQSDPATLSPQPAPAVDPATGLVECHWSSFFHVTIGADWTPGLYVARLQAADGGTRYAPFVVRDERRADVIAVFPTATAQAYNGWGGESLYEDARFQFPIGHAYEVSYDRPFLDGLGGGSLIVSTLAAVQFLEANGYDVTYLADHDVSRTPSPINRAKLVLTLAHDEYWTRAMRDHYEQARATGVSLGFLGANTGYWQVRLAPAADGMPDRRQVGYKEAADLDPLRHHDDPNVTASFRSPIINRPENALLGIMSSDWHVVDFPWIVGDASSWVYQGMNLSRGDAIPGLVGVESDRVIDNGLTPAGLVVLSDSPTIGGDSVGRNRQQAAVYPGPGGNFVFAAGSIRFPGMLAGRRGQVGAQRIVRNLIAHAGGATGGPEQTLGASDGFLSADLTHAAAQIDTLAGAAGMPGFADGLGTQARFDSPMGIAVAKDGAIIVADAGNLRIRRIAPGPDHVVTTLAGDGTAGDRDGPGAGANFHTPFAVAICPDGTIAVSDPKGHRVRTINPGGMVATVATMLPEPAGLACADDGTLYVSDLVDGKLRAIPPGEMPHTVTAKGNLAFATGLIADGTSLYILESGLRMIRRLTLGDGTLTRITGDSEGGFADGDGSAARLWPMLGIARLPTGALIVGDTGNNRLRLIEPGADLASTHVRTLAGTTSTAHTDGPGEKAAASTPRDQTFTVLKSRCRNSSATDLVGTSVTAASP